MNVILAAADDLFLEPLSAIREFIVSQVDIRDAVVDTAETAGAEVVVLSPELPGEADIIDIVEELLDLNVRIVFLAGRLHPNNLTIKKLVELGVYDVLFEPVTIGRLKDAIFNPATQFNAAAPADTLENTETEEQKERSLSRFRRKSSPRGRNKQEFKTTIPNVFGICSPVPTGKTMVALNLASVLALRGYSVGLVDLDLTQMALGNWVEVSDGEDGIYRLLKEAEKAIEYGYSPRLLPGLFLFTAARADVSFTTGKKTVAMLLQSLAGAFDFVVVDTRSDLSDIATAEIISLAGQIIMVADSDFNHLKKFQSVMDGLPDNVFPRCSLVANRTLKSDVVLVSDTEDAVGLKPDAVIPETTEVLESIKAGVPVALFNQEIKQALDNYAGFLISNMQQVVLPGSDIQTG